MICGWMCLIKLYFTQNLINFVFLSLLSKIQPLHPQLDTETSDSELCEILQVSSIILKSSNQSELKITHKTSEVDVCPRCRRFAATNGICMRCENVLKSKNTSMS